MDALTPYVSVNSSTFILHSLNDATKCTVEKSESGRYVLQLTCPYNGEHADMLVAGNIIFAKSSRVDSEPERFEISKITQSIDGLVSVEANQLTYSLSRYPVRAFEKASRTPAEAVAALFANSVRDPSSDHLYLTASDTGSAEEFGFDRPVSFREAVYGNGGLLDVYGGRVKATLYNLSWHKVDSLAASKGVIRYGVNLQKYKRVVDVTDTYSHAYVFWRGRVDVTDENGEVTGSEEKLVEVPGLVQLTGNETFTGATIIDLSNEFESMPTTAQLTEKAQNLAAQRGLSSAQISLDISFVPLRLTDEYKDLTFLEEVDLFDTVEVEVPMYGKTRARVTSTKFNVLSESYEQISLGNAKAGIGRLIARLIPYMR